MKPTHKTSGETRLKLQQNNMKSQNQQQQPTTKQSNQWRCKDPKQCEIRRAESLQPVTPRTAAARENIPAINFAKLGIEQLNDDGSSSKSGHWSKIDSETESSEDDHWQRRCVRIKVSEFLRNTCESTSSNTLYWVECDWVLV
eukprot:c20268_g2_i3.p2 GENE.c20268_g2_i3~~c20268_g2_i3.p2  ORF type:complete len:143 (+),score=22.76 c20268_g2_i3:14-442(+)